MKHLALIALVALLVVAGLYFFATSLMEKNGVEGQGEVEQKAQLPVFEALQSIEPPETYHLVAEQLIDGPNLSLNRTLHVWKSGKDIVVRLVDDENLLDVWYVLKNDSEKVCIEFTQKVCGDASVLPVYANSLKREEVKRFLNTYSAQIQLLESKGALNLTSMKEGGECKKELEFSYSFGDLPLKDLQEANLFLSAEALKTRYSSKLCLEDTYIKRFVKDYENSAGTFHEESNVLLFETSNITLPEVEGEYKEPDVFKAYYEEYKNFYDEMIKADDPQLRSLAKQYRLPEICNKASDRDFCLLTYAQSTKEEEVCDSIANETLKQECKLPFQQELNETVEGG